MIPVHTPKGRFRVWTKRIGNSPRVKLLLLHGGPGITHEHLEPCDSWLPAAGVEYYYYDQLGSHYSDQPDEPELWEIDRFVDEVEQVRVALGLDRGTFLYGQSWGGLLALEYALAHQQNLKGLIISNMMASVPAYNDYAATVHFGCSSLSMRISAHCSAAISPGGSAARCSSCTFQTSQFKSFSRHSREAKHRC
jgi:proline iminopeptidase